MYEPVHMKKKYLVLSEILSGLWRNDPQPKKLAELEDLKRTALDSCPVVRKKNDQARCNKP